MGHKIGVPSLKLNNVGYKSKSCGSFASVAYEAFEERKGKDQDIDPERTKENIYLGMRSAEHLLSYSRQHMAQLRDARGRALRSDAVAMCATIFKPPAAYMASLSDEEGNRLLMDCFEFFKSVVGEDNIKSFIIHDDELGKHAHCFWEPMTIDGRLSAKECHGLTFFRCINEHLPAFLRERGWDIEDADCYDRAQKEKNEERKEQRKKNGRSSAQYKRDAEREKNQLIAENERLMEKNDQLKQANKELEDQREGLTKDVGALLTIQNDEEMDNAVGEITRTMERVERHLQEQEELLEELEEAARWADSRAALAAALQEGVFLLKQITDTIRSLLKKITVMLKDVIRYGVFFRREDVKPIVNRLQQQLEKATIRAKETPLGRGNSNLQGKEIV